MMIRQITWFTALALGLTTLSHAETTPIGTAVEPLVLASPAAVDPSLVATAVNPVTSQVAPVRDVVYPFAKLAPPPGNFSLLSVKPEGQLEFGVRSDEVVTQATLNLEFTPSPSLTPIESQLKIYLNDELMNVMAITREQLGKSNRIQLSIDPRYITDFNRLRLVFIGHYQGVCENPTNSALWLNIGKASSLDLRYQSLPLKNDLSHFPEPFFDTRDSQALTLPIVFAAAPNVEQQKAAAILASWFGQQAQWRGQHFPVTFN